MQIIVEVTTPLPVCVCVPCQGLQSLCLYARYPERISVCIPMSDVCMFPLVWLGRCLPFLIHVVIVVVVVLLLSLMVQMIVCRGRQFLVLRENVRVRMRVSCEALHNYDCTRKCRFYSHSV